MEPMTQRPNRLGAHFRKRKAEAPKGKRPWQLEEKGCGFSVSFRLSALRTE